MTETFDSKRLARLAGHALCVHLRFPKPADVPRLVELMAQTGFAIPESIVHDQLNALTSVGDWVRVAERNGVVVGIITVHDTPLLHRAEPVARVTLLAVDSDHSGSGVGSALLAEAESAARERGIRIMEVISNHRFQEAHQFYEQRGYEQSSLKFKKSLS